MFIHFTQIQKSLRTQAQINLLYFQFQSIPPLSLSTCGVRVAVEAQAVAPQTTAEQVPISKEPWLSLLARL